MTEQYAALTVEQQGAVTEVVLSRPDLLNRFDSTLHSELTQVVLGIAHDRSTRAVVLGSTGRVFSAGGDFELMISAHDDVDARRAPVEEGRQLLGAFLDLPQPVVAAVQGPAIGLGATLALACDALVASRSASLADPHVGIGLVAGDGGCLVWPAAAGMLRARRHLLTGDPVDAGTGLQLGLITDLVDEPEQVLPAARELAARMAALPPLAVQGTKRALNAVTRRQAADVADLSLAYEEQTLASADVLEAIAAFRDRRPPRYSGR